jgi:hypothetical protein
MIELEDKVPYQINHVRYIICDNKILSLLKILIIWPCDPQKESAVCVMTTKERSAPR